MPLVPTVATPVEPLLQVPPGLGSDRAVVAPTQILIGPGGVIADGLALAVTVAVTKHVPML